MQSYFSEIRTNSWSQCIKHVYAAWNRPACNGVYVRLTSWSTGPGQEHWKTADSGPWPVDRSTSNTDKRCWHSRRETPPNQCTTCMLNTDWNKIDLSHITHVWSHYLNQNETNVWFRYLLLVEKLQLHVSLRQTHKCHTINACCVPVGLGHWMMRLTVLKMLSSTMGLKICKRCFIRCVTKLMSFVRSCLVKPIQPVQILCNRSEC